MYNSKHEASGKFFYAYLISCSTSNRYTGLCSSGERTMIGRQVDELTPAISFHLLSYENTITKFVKVDAYDGLVMAIDQDGEIWVLYGH